MRVEERSRSRTALSLRGLVLIVCALEALVWLLLVWNGLTTTSDPATRGLDGDIAMLGTAVFAASGAPALALAWSGRLIPLAAFLATFPLAALVATVLVF